MKRRGFIITSILGAIAGLFGIKPKKQEYWEMVFPAVPGFCDEMRIG